MDLEYIFRVGGHILQNSGNTIFLFLLAIVMSIPLGFLITMLLKCPLKPLNWLAEVYVYILRGTPLLLQLMFVYFGLPYIPGIGPYLKLTPFTAAVIAFVLNYAAYFANIFKGGLLAIDKGQYEAAQVLGISRFHTYTRIILPQMFRVCLPSVSNETITLIKDTALVFAVSVPDILETAKTAASRDFSTMPYIIAAVIYLLLNLLLTMLFKKLEKKFSIE